VWRENTPALAADAPNIVIFMTDDAGCANGSPFGGPIQLPTMERVLKMGVGYNRFHTTAMCSPTRACVLTGRNHHAVGFGQIPEYATDFDGYVGVIPRSAATIAEVLGGYGYGTAAFGKWHNTPIDHVTGNGPFDRWPTGHGFDYFYGFVAAETSQYEPRLFENTTAIEPPDGPGYHLTEDLADKAIAYLRRRQNTAPDQPALIYFTPGAVHGPHHIPADWADKYAGVFDDGWEAIRERIFKAQQELGWIPENAELTPIDDTMQRWDDVPEEHRRFQTRLMEVYAGFAEHTDHQYGKVLDELERLGELDNTLVFYVNSDNGASAEGLFGSIAEILCHNGLRIPVDEQIEVLERDYGGIDALGTEMVDNHYHAGWAWATDTPFKSTKLVAAHFGGTRTPLAVAWPDRFGHDPVPRDQFHHVIDLAATIYDALGIEPPAQVDGVDQKPIDGVSLLPSLTDVSADSGHTTQYFEIMGSRGIYHDGWFAGAFGPRNPWDPKHNRFRGWDPDEDVWELYDLEADYSQAHDLASTQPERLAELKRQFDEHAEANQAFPIGGGLLTSVFRPDLMKSTTLSEWIFGADDDRIVESMAPKFFSGYSSESTVQFTGGPDDSGVLFCVGGISGGFTVFVDQGVLIAEYNMSAIQRTQATADTKLQAGPHQAVITVQMESDRYRCPADVSIELDGTTVATARIERTVPAMFTFSETFDVGKDLGSPVSLQYTDRKPFAFTGSIESVRCRYLQT
jgi:arylsulfatase